MPTVVYYVYYAIISILCLLCHIKRFVCHTMSTRVLCYVYNVILSCSVTGGTLCLPILCLLFQNKPLICHTLPIKMSCYPHYKTPSCSDYCALISQPYHCYNAYSDMLCRLGCRNKPTSYHTTPTMKYYAYYGTLCLLCYTKPTVP